MFRNLCYSFREIIHLKDLFLLQNTLFFRPTNLHLGSFPHFRAHLSHAELLSPVRPQAFQQIGAGKQNVESVQILADSSINDFSVSKLIFNGQKRVFYFAADG